MTKVIVGVLILVASAFCMIDCAGTKDANQAIGAGFFAVVLLAAGVLLVSRGVSGGPRVECPHCKERIRIGAAVCRYCGRDLQSPKATA